MAEDKMFIHNWLLQPYSLNGQERQHVAELLQRYPYFVPAKFMKDAQEYEQGGFSTDLVHNSQFHRGNWMMFYDMMIASKNVKNEVDAIEKDVITDDLQTIITNDQELELDQEEQFILDDFSGLEAATLDTEQHKNDELTNLVQPLYVDNYFQHQGIAVKDDIPTDLNTKSPVTDQDEKSLMVMMGFDEWLLFLKKKNEAKKSEEQDKAYIRSIWQREKLAAAIGEEDENIPEAVFEMAINSIDKQDIMVSESLAEIHVKQGHYEKAIEIYRKLSLQNPEKKTYFAAKINHLNKEKLS